MKLGEILVSHGLLAPGQLEQALATQRQFGGRLGTNLVELGFVTEEQLAMCLSHQLKIPFARAEAVAAIDPQVIAFVPKQVAQKYRFIPLRYDGRDLYVCLADPQDLGRVDEISFALGCRVRPNVITEVTLNYALERYYGIRREARFLHNAASTSPPPVEVGAPLSPMSTSDRGARSGLWTIPQGMQASASLDSLLDQLSQVMSDIQVVDVGVRVLGKFFDEVALLQIVDGRVLGRLAGGRGGQRRDISSIQFALPESPLLAEVVAKHQTAHRPQLADTLLMRVCASSALPVHLVTIVPVPDGSAIGYVALCQGTDAGKLKASYESLKAIVGKITSALQIVALRNQIRAPAAWAGGWVG